MTRPDQSSSAPSALVSKRDLLRGTGALAAAGALGLGRSSLGLSASAQDTATAALPVPPPITGEERASRVDKAQRLMQERGMAGILLEPGPSMVYFTGLTWWRSERLTGVILPAKGRIGIVTPAFEEASIAERLEAPAEIRTWNEDESPFRRVAAFLNDRGLSGPLGIEDSVRFFVAEGLRRAMPDREIIPAAPVVTGCRMIKSPREIALMQAANDITMAAYRDIYPRVETGMTGPDISAMMTAATRARGGEPTFSLALVGPASSFPHGSDIVHRVEQGSVVLMDCGCDVHGYQSDISRTWVHGETDDAELVRVWNTVRRGQELALETARVGTPAGRVDEVVREFYASEGWGPDYELPGLSHRLGHGIGMEGHEPINFVLNEDTPLAPGMCLSNEPGIYVPGKYGVRLEDCLHMTEEGPVLFSGLAPSLGNPIG